MEPVNTYDSGRFSTSGAVIEKESALLSSVFSWMMAGLLTTGFVGAWVMSNPALLSKIMPNILWIALAELFVVGWLFLRVHKMSAATATTVFFVYAAANGLTMAPLLAYASPGAVSTSFWITAVTFGGMALWGKTTSRDLSGMGSFLIMGFFGAFIASLVNLFMGSPMISFVTSIIFVIACTGLTAWDVQRIKQVAPAVQTGTPEFRRQAIIGALSLYLNFIIVFQNLISLMGGDD